MKKQKVMILGGGLSGLSAADKLLGYGFDVTILEHATFLGGLASSFRLNNEELPRFNHHVVKSNITTLKYLNKYNLLGNNKWHRVKMAFGFDGILYNINSPIGLLKFKHLSLWGRARLGFFGIYSIFLLNPDRISDNMDLDTWMDRHAGKEVKEKIWKQLYGRNKFNISLKDISAKQFAHRLFEKEGYDLFTYPEKGLQGMIDGLGSDVKNKGGRIIYPARIMKINLKDKELSYDKNISYEKNKISYEKNKKIWTEKFDIIINTIPVPELIKITTGLPTNYVRQVKKLRYVPVVGLAFGTKDFLDKKMYWINLFHERVHVVYQHSLIIDKYKHKISWCVRYGGSEEDLYKSDEEIKKLYLDVLKKYFPDMDVKWCLVFREKYAEPIYDKDYPEYGPKYLTPVPYLFNSGIQVTFPKIRNMNVALESGEKVAEMIKEKFGRNTRKLQ